MVDFLKMPSLILTPGVYIEQDNSKLGAVALVGRPRVLIMGQKLAAGNAVAGQAYRIDGGAAQAKALFGRGSQLADAVAGYRDNDETLELWALGLADDAGGTAATYTITYTGPATAAGTVDLMVTHQRVTVPVTSGMTATQVATAVAAAINLYPDLVFTAASAAGVVTLTARHKGGEFNGLFIKANWKQGTTPAGLTVAIAAAVSGATNPDASAAIAALGDTTWAHIVTPWNDGSDLVLADLCEDRAGPSKMNYSEAYIAKIDSYSNFLTYSLSTRDSAYGLFLCIKLGCMPHSPWRVMAAYVAQIAVSAQADPALPFNGLVLKGILPPRETDWFTRQEREFLLEGGGATLFVRNGAVCIERAVTTSKTNALGQEDYGQRDLNTVLTTNYLSASARTYLQGQFPRYKIADDASIYPAEARVTDCRQIKAALVTLAASDWVEKGLIENLEGFKTSLQVVRHAGDTSRADWQIRPDLVNGLHVLAGQVQPLL